MKIKKIIKIFLLFFILNIILFCNSCFAESHTDLQIYSEAAILINKDTSQILYSKNINQKMYPASTTKILTAILAIEHFSLDDKLTASYEAIMSIPSGYSNAAIQVGESLTVKELLEVFLVHSANEAGYILGENISGSISAFADLMNKKAEEIGCKNTHFTNPSGLHDKNHYTTAYDLALIAQYCMNNETFRSIVSMPSCRIAPTDKYEERYFRNTNEMLNSKSQYYNENVIGIKTGFTSQAQNCLIAGFKKDNVEFISVVLGAPGYIDIQKTSGKFTDTQTLFDYGYENFSYKTVVSEKETISEIEVANAAKDTKNLELVSEKNITVFGNKSGLENLNPVIKINENITAPIKAGDILGTVTYTVDDVTYTSNLLAKNDVKSNNFFENILKIVFVLVILIVIYRTMFSKRKKKKKNGKKPDGKYLYGRVKY